MKRIMVLLCLGGISIATAGCGFALVHGPPTGEARSSDLTCTRSNVGPTLDVVAALSGVGLVIVAAESQGFDDYFYYVSDEFAAVGGVMAVLYGISAYVGFRKTRRCREAGVQFRSPPAATGGEDSAPTHPRVTVVQAREAEGAGWLVKHARQ